MRHRDTSRKNGGFTPSLKFALGDSFARLLHQCVRLSISRASCHKSPRPSGARANSSAGFTLIETSIVAAIFTMIMLVLVTLYINFGHFAQEQRAAIEVVHTAGRIAYEVQNATLAADSIVASHTFSGLALTSATDTLVVELPAVDTSDNIVPATYDYIGIYATGTSAYKVTDAAAGSARTSGSVLLSDVLASLEFSYDALSPSLSTSVEVDVETSDDIRGLTPQTHVHEKTYLRN